MWTYLMIAVLAWGGFLLAVAGIVRATDQGSLSRRTYAATIAKAGGVALFGGLLGVLCLWLALAAWAHDTEVVDRYMTSEGTWTTTRSNWMMQLAALALFIGFVGLCPVAFWFGLKALFTGQYMDEKKAKIPKGAKAETKEQREARHLIVWQSEIRQDLLASLAACTPPDESGCRLVPVSLYPYEGKSGLVTVKIGSEVVGYLQSMLGSRLNKALQKHQDGPPPTVPAEVVEAPIEIAGRSGIYYLRLHRKPSSKELARAA